MLRRIADLENDGHLRKEAVVVGAGRERQAIRSGLERDTLRSLINKKRLKATKQGRDWIVELADLYTYLESRDARGGGKKRELARAS